MPQPHEVGVGDKLAKVGTPGRCGQVVRLGGGTGLGLARGLPVVPGIGLPVPATGLGTVVGWGRGFADRCVCQRPDLWLGGRDGYARRGFAVPVVAVAPVVSQAHHVAVISLICKCKTSFEFSINCNRVISGSFIGVTSSSA